MMDFFIRNGPLNPFHSMNLQILYKDTIYFSDSQGKWGIIWKNK